jgi:accessory gene regulator protein AgrB
LYKGGVTTMSDDEEERTIAVKFAELTPAAREFLSDIDDDDVDLLKYGLNLIKSLRTVGRLMKILIIFLLGIFFGVVMLWESIVKFLKLWKDLTG